MAARSWKQKAAGLAVLVLVAGGIPVVATLALAAVPDAPAAPTATPGNASASVSWTAPADNGSPITGYTVTSTPASAGCTTATTSCTVPGLTNGTSYTFTVVADNADGSSGTSPASTSITPRTVPDAPSGVGATAANAALNVSWTAPANNGGSAVTGYTATAYDASTGGTAQGTCTIATTSCTISSLTNGTTYYVEVTAANVAGSGAASSPRVSGTPVALPSAPQSVTATGADGSISISWAAPSSDGGSAITGYTAEVFTAATGGSAVDTCVPASLSSLTCTSSGRTNGTTYYVSVKATNANGTGDSSSRVSVVAGAQASAPTSVAAVRGDGSIVVSWKAPTSDGGSPITGYEANAYTSTSSSASVAASCTTTGLECTISGVSNGTVYYVSVAAITSVRTGAASSRVTVAAAGVPGAPRSVTVTRANGYAVVKWAAPATTGGATISRYQAQAFKDLTGGDPIATCAPAAGKGLECNLGPLPNGSTYFIDVVAFNAIGLTATSEPRISVITAALADAPTGVTAVLAGKSVNVAWQVPRSDGGMPIREYVASAYSLASGGTLMGSCRTSGAACSITGLLGPPVYVDVVAVTGAGSGPASAPRIRVVIYDPADPVQYVSASPAGRSLQVSWQPPARDGRQPIQWYKASAWDALTGGTKAGECTVGVDTAKPGPASAGSQSRVGCTIKALSAQGTYYVDVEATTSVGSTSSGARIPVSMRLRPPAEPRGVTLLPGDREIAVIGAAPATDGGSAIERYVARAWNRQTGGQVAADCSVRAQAEDAQFSCVLTDLDNFEPYWVEVWAVNAQGRGPATARATIEPKPSAPSAPRGVRTLPRNGGLLVSWQPPIFDGGYPVREYQARAYLMDATGAKASTTAAKDCTVRAPQTSCVLAGFTEGQLIQVEVTASNTFDVGVPSARVDATMVPSVPPAPGDIAAKPTEGGVSISWTPPAGAMRPILGYRVRVLDSAGGKRPVGSCETSQTSCRVKVSRELDSAAIEVQARNEQGWGDVERITPSAGSLQ